MQKYTFDVEHNYPDGMIPRAIYQAQNIKVDESLREQWEAGIQRQVEIDEAGGRPSFSWNNFISSITP